MQSGQGPGWELLSQVSSLVREQIAQEISNYFIDSRRREQQREKKTDAGIAIEERGTILLYKGTRRKRRWEKAEKDELKTYEGRRLEQE